MREIFLPDSLATENAGACFAAWPGWTGLRQIHLQGDLGAGKTTWVRGLLRGLGYQGVVRSPTYTLLETYEIAGVFLLHLDLYRLSDPDELNSLGLFDYGKKSVVWLVEWPEKGRGWLPPPDLVLYLSYCDSGRSLRWSGTAENSLYSVFQDLEKCR